MPEIVQLLVSGGHRYEGRPSVELPPAPDERVPSLEVRARLGVVGDRYFNRPAHRDAAVTIMAIESLAGLGVVDLRQTRRNVLLRGVDVDSGAGRVLSLDSGHGAVLLRLRRRANPCAWMDAAIGPGAWRALRGRGGMRCEPLSDGILLAGPVTASWLDEDSSAEVGGVTVGDVEVGGVAIGGVEVGGVAIGVGSATVRA